MNRADLKHSQSDISLGGSKEETCNCTLATALSLHTHTHTLTNVNRAMSEHLNCRYFIRTEGPAPVSTSSMSHDGNGMSAWRWEVMDSVRSTDTDVMFWRTASEDVLLQEWEITVALVRHCISSSETPGGKSTCCNTAEIHSVSQRASWLDPDYRVLLVSLYQQRYACYLISGVSEQSDQRLVADCSSV